MLVQWTLRRFNLLALLLQVLNERRRPRRWPLKTEAAALEGTFGPTPIRTREEKGALHELALDVVRVVNGDRVVLEGLVSNECHQSSGSVCFRIPDGTYST